MRGFALAAGLCLSLWLLAAPAEAQYRYTDDTGIVKVTQYKVDIPMRHRDAAVWIGPRGIGKPALSEEQRQIRRRADAYRRIGEAIEHLRPYGGATR